MWNREIKQTNHGYMYCDVALCKNKLTFFTQLKQQLKVPVDIITNGCAYNRKIT